MPYNNGLQDAVMAAQLPYRVKAGVGQTGGIDDALPNNWQFTADNAAGTAKITYLIPADANNLTQLNNPNGVQIAGSILASVTNSITAFSGGGQASAVPLTTVLNRVTVVAAPNDSVKLPAAVAGNYGVVVKNAAANSLNVFPFLGDQINALGANVAFALAAAKTAEFVCIVTGTWDTFLSA